MEPFLILVLTALGEGLFLVGSELVKKILVDPASQEIKHGLLRKFESLKDDERLKTVIEQAIQKSGAPTEDEDKLKSWIKGHGFTLLEAKNSVQIRKQLAYAVLEFTDPAAEPPEDLRSVLRWHPSETRQLAAFLTTIRSGMAALDGWKDLLAYTDDAERNGLLRSILAEMKSLDRLILHSPQGDALRVIIQKKHLSQEEFLEIETCYRDHLERDLRMHSFRGITQMKQDMRVPLADLYLELSLLRLGKEEKENRWGEDFLKLSDAERTEREEKRLMEKRVTDVLAEAQRLVILGDPGSGKTISLRFIALMLSYGYGISRLGLEKPYVPLLVRLSDYARELDKRPQLSLDNFLLEYIQEAYSASEELGKFLRMALEQGLCMVLLDGLDELDTNSRSDVSERSVVVRKVQSFADIWCCPDRLNRLVVSSRIEGYWRDPLSDFEHVELSPLRPPDEIEAFLLHWFEAHECSHQEGLSRIEAFQRAKIRVDDMLPRLMNVASVRRLATNPLLLTLLALIYENVGHLPNRRVKLYEYAAGTLIESWRQSQVGLKDELLAEFGEETIIRIMAPLAYWMHEEHPGGTASFEEWHSRLKSILEEQGFENEAVNFTDRFLQHARFQTGLLAERGLGQFGFFHLTFEEYLAAREIARQRVEDRRRMILDHWKDPRWHEVLLLAAGQLGIIESRQGDTSDYLQDFLDIESEEPELVGQPQLLAGRALADIGLRSVTPVTCRGTKRALKGVMQDLDAETEKPNQQAVTPIRTRADAGEVLDELGWLPEDLHAFVEITHARLQKLGISYPAWLPERFFISKYPITNSQYQRFVEDERAFSDPALWRSFAKFDHKGKPMQKDWGDEGWGWLQERLREGEDTKDGRRLLPWLWNDPRFGVTRHGAPVVGVSWYEANAFCRWLARNWETDLCSAWRADNPVFKPGTLRLPTEIEWVAAAGGAQPKERFPWDGKNAVTNEIEEILKRCNVKESRIECTTPVGMYPLGESPLGVWDLSGNAWEWQSNFYERNNDVLALRGGSGNNDHRSARLSSHRTFGPKSRWLYLVGFRVVAFPS